MFAQPTVVDGSVRPLNVGVLLWLARLDIVDADVPPSGPVDERVADKLWSVIAANGCWLRSPFQQLLCSTRITRSVGSEKPASMASPSRR